MIPKLFEANETKFDHNGIGLLFDALSCEVTEERNGVFDLELVYPITGMYFSELVNNNIIHAKPNDKNQPHAFRINEIDKSLSSSEVTVYASSITNDLGGNMLKKLVVENTTPQIVLNELKKNLLYPTSLNFISDITTIGSVNWELNNPLNLLVGQEGSLVDIFGGEIKRTDDTIYLYGRRGNDNVTTIRSKKNLLGFNMTESFRGKYTQILPYLKYEEEVDPDNRNNNERREVIVYGDVVSSKYVDNYPFRIIKPIDFSRYDELEEDKSKAALDKLAKNYFTSMYPGIDLPSIDIKVDMLQLIDSEEFKLLKKLEEIELCDTVTVYVPEYDVDVLVKITGLKYDVIRERTISITAGSSSRTSLMDEVSGEYKSYTNSVVNDKIQEATAGIINDVLLQKDGVAIYSGRVEPPSDAKEGDLWFKSIGEGEIETYVFNGQNWIRKMHNGFGDDIRTLVDEKIAESNVVFNNKINEINTVIFDKDEDIRRLNLRSDMLKTEIDNVDADLKKKMNESFISLSNSINRLTNADNVLNEHVLNQTREINNVRGEILGIENKILSYKYGGRNLLLDTASNTSSKLINLGYWEKVNEEYMGVPVLRRRHSWFGIFTPVKVYKGNVYTLSYYYKVDEDFYTDDIKQIYHQFHYGAFQGMSTEKYPPCSYRVVKNDRTFLDSTNQPPNTWLFNHCVVEVTSDGWIFPRIEKRSSTGYLYIGPRQFELGNVPSQWRPNEEDITIEESNYRRSVDTLFNELNKSVRDINGNIVTQNSTIEQLNSVISLKVSREELTPIKDSLNKKVEISQVRSEISTGINGITQEVSSIRGVLDGGISARNYASSTSTPVTNTINTGYFVVNNLYSTSSNIPLSELGFSVGDTYSIMFDIYADNKMSFDCFRIEAYNNNYLYRIGDIFFSIGSQDNPTKMHISHTIRDTTQLSTFRWMIRFDKSNLTYTVKNFRVFKGTIKQDWYPAWEDQKNAIDQTSSRLDITDQKISALISGQRTLPGGQENTYITRMEAMQGEISQRVTTRQLNDSLPKDVGGRNLVTGSADLKNGNGRWDTGTWRDSGSGGRTEYNINLPSSPIKNITKGVKLTSTDNNQWGIAQDGNMVYPGVYTFSVWVKGSAGLKIRLNPLYSQDSSNPSPYVERTYTLESSEWTLLSNTFEVTKIYTNASLAYMFVFSPGEAYFAAPYIHKSSMIGDWTPAPEDSERTVNAISSNVDISSFSSRILSRMAMGQTLINNPRFERSDMFDENGTSITPIYYNNVKDSTGVTVTRVSEQQGQPNSQEYIYRIDVNDSGGISPGYGGFQMCRRKVGILRHGGEYVFRFVAKLPKGYVLDMNNNSYGNTEKGGYKTWITPNIGTGRIETYAFYYRFGDDGNITDYSTGWNYAFPFVSVLRDNASLPFTWYLFDAELYDISDPEQRLKNYVTNETFTTYSADRQQTDRQITESITQAVSMVPTGAVNLIQNGFDQRDISPWRNQTPSKGNLGLTNHLYFYSNRKNLLVYSTTVTDKSTFISNTFNLKKNTNYTIRIGFIGNINCNTVRFCFGRGYYSTGTWTDISNWSLTYPYFTPNVRELEYKTMTVNSENFNIGLLSIDIMGSKTDGQIAQLFVAEVSIFEGTLNNAWAPSYDELITEQKFHETKSTVDSFSRIIGREEDHMLTNLARNVMTDAYTITEISKYSDRTNNLIVDAINFSQISTNGLREENIVRIPEENRIKFSSYSQNTNMWAGIRFPTYVPSFRQGDTYTLSFDYYVHGNNRLNGNFYVQLPNTKINTTIGMNDLLENENTFESVKDRWKTFTKTFTITRSTPPDESSERLFIWVLKGGTISIRNLMFVKGSVIGPFSASNTDNVSTRVEQTANSYAVKSLIGPNQIKSEMNLSNDGIRLKSNLIHLDGNVTVSGTAWMSGAIIKDLSADKITTGTLDANRVRISNLTVNSVSGINAEYLRATIGDAFIDWMRGKRITAMNGAMTINLDQANIHFRDNARIEFGSQDNALYRVRNGTAAFIHFRDDSYNGVYTAMGVNADNSGNLNDYSGGLFAGVRVIRSNPQRYNGNYVDEVQLVGDTINIRHAYGYEHDFVRIKMDGGNRIDLVPWIRAVSARLGIGTTY